MVTISLVAILTTIGYSTYSSVQKNARDTDRKNEVDAIAKAMELNYGKYKTNQYSGLCQTGYDSSGFPKYDCASWFGNGSLPTDPQQSSTRYYYWCDSACVDNTTGFKLAAGEPAENKTTWYICADLEISTPTPYCKKNQF